MTQQLTEEQQAAQDQKLEELYEQMIKAAGTPKFNEMQDTYFAALREAVNEVEVDADGFERPVGGRVDPDPEPGPFIFARGQFLT